MAKDYIAESFENSLKHIQEDSSLEEDKIVDDPVKQLVPSTLRGASSMVVYLSDFQLPNDGFVAGGSTIKYDDSHMIAMKLPRPGGMA